MKKIFITLLLLTAMTSYGQKQRAFGVSPGLSLNSAYLGWKSESKIMPYIALRAISFNSNLTETGKEIDWENNRLVDFEDVIKSRGSIYVPTIGFKYFMSTSEKTQSFLNVNISKPLIFFNSEKNGQNNKNLEDEIKKNTSLWGGEISYGMEYFLDESFSLGGEFGLMILLINYKDTNDQFVFDPDMGEFVESKTTYDLNLNLRPTFTRITFNYYLNR